MRCFEGENVEESQLEEHIEVPSYSRPIVVRFFPRKYLYQKTEGEEQENNSNKIMEKDNFKEEF